MWLCFHGVQITSNGNLYAENGYFRGSVNAGNIQYGGNAGYFSGVGISSGSIYGNRMVANTISTAYTSSGINSTLSHADWSYGVLNGWTMIEKISAKWVYANDGCHVGSLSVGGSQISKKSVVVKNSAGNNVTLYYLGW